jgi:hypothetical protein
MSEKFAELLMANLDRRIVESEGDIELVKSLMHYRDAIKETMLEMGHEI